MITGSAVYQVVEAMAPLYTAAVLGYASVRWLGAFSDEQCAGINHFVALYAVSVLIFHMVSTNDPYAMNGRLIAADTLQKAVMLLGLMAWAIWPRSGRRGGGKVAAAAVSPLQWVVTAFSLAALPNTIIMGMPLLNGMYGAVSKDLMKQIVVMQFCVWYNVVIFLYEYMAARRAATARDGSAKISPASSVSASITEKGDFYANGDGIVTAQRAHEATVNIEIKDITVASTGQEGVAGETTTTTTVAKEVSTGGDVTASEAEEVQLPALKPAPSVRHVVWMAGKKVLKIPNTYASFLGLIWALIAFKCGIKMPKIIDDSLFTIGTTAVGLSMFASGTFIARQARFVPCGYAIASISMVIKFLIGPVVMLLASLAIGLHGTLLHIAVVQTCWRRVSALPRIDAVQDHCNAMGVLVHAPCDEAVLDASVRSPHQGCLRRARSPSSGILPLSSELSPTSPRVGPVYSLGDSPKDA